MHRRPSDFFSDFKPQETPLAPDNSIAIDELVARHTPDHLKDPNAISLGSVPLISVLNDPNKLIADIVYQVTATKRFPQFAPIVSKNAALAALNEKSKDEYLSPLKSRLMPVPLARAFLANTPLLEKLLQPTPYRITDKKRFEHTHVLARTGHGKSNTLLHLVSQDVQRPNPPSLIIIEPKNDLIRDISRLKLNSDIAIIDPNNHPAFNLFAFPDRLKSSPHRDQAVANIIHQYSQALAALDTDASNPQQTAMAYVIELVVAMKGTLHDFIRILEDPAREFEKSDIVPDLVKSLPSDDQDFFKYQFYSGTVPSSRRSVAMKLRRLKKTASQFKAMLEANTNAIDMYERMKLPGSITLINTSEGTLTPEASTFFGRLLLGQILSAALERQARREFTHPVFVVIDEAQLYLSDDIEKFLFQTRSAKVGITIAHHNLKKLNQLRDTVLSEPAVRIAAASPLDADAIAMTMRKTSPEVFGELDTGQFIAYVQGQGTGVKIDIPYRSIDALPHLSDDEYADFLARNRSRFADKPKEKGRQANALQDSPPPSSQPTRKRPAPDDD
jgi:hypothetical protein